MDQFAPVFSSTQLLSIGIFWALIYISVFIFDRGLKILTVFPLKGLILMGISANLNQTVGI
jgi:hypothetical protein